LKMEILLYLLRLALTADTLLLGHSIKKFSFGANKHVFTSHHN